MKARNEKNILALTLIVSLMAMYGAVSSTNAHPIMGTVGGSMMDNNIELSSIHYKENIRNLDDHSGRIYDLNPILFDFKNAAWGGSNQFGLIAEEVEPVLPELVNYAYFEANDTNLTNELSPDQLEDQYEVDEETGERVLISKAKEGVAQVVTVTYSKLIPLMLNELKKIKADTEKISDLEQENAELKQKVLDLESRLLILEDMLKSEQGSVTVQLG